MSLWNTEIESLKIYWGKKKPMTWACALQAVRIHPIKQWAPTTRHLPYKLRTISISHTHVLKDLVAPVGLRNAGPRHSRSLLHRGKDWLMWEIKVSFSLVWRASRSSETFDPCRPQQIRLLLQGAALQSSFFLSLNKHQVTDTYRTKGGKKPTVILKLSHSNSPALGKKG